MPFQTGLARALRSRGLDVIEHPGWQTLGSASFTPKGVVCHHTAIADVGASVCICTDGRPDLPGPLCQVVLGPEGTCHLIAAGRANHAGPGGWKGLSGNSSVFGIEAVHSGLAKDGWPLAQLEAYHRCCVAMLDLIGSKNAGYVCAHKEWTTRKIDPISLDMGQFRAAVQVILDGGGTEVDMLEPVDAMADPKGGFWVLSKDGSIRAYRGARYLGATNGKDYWGDREAKALEAVGDAYAILATTNERYGPGF